MKVLLAAPGHLPTAPMGRYCMAALRRLGHDALLFDLRPRWLDRVVGLRRGLDRGGWIQSANRRLCRVAARERPELFLALFGFDVAESTLSSLRKMGIATACWWLNDPFQLGRSLRQAGWYDGYFTNARGCLEEYRAAGFPHVRFLPLAVDRTVHCPQTLSPEERSRYESDICFAGDWGPPREEWIARLMQTHRVRVWGPWGKKLARDSRIRTVLTDGCFTPEEMVKAFAGAKLVLNLHGWIGKWPYGVNPRLFEAAGVGACQLVDRKEEIPSLFQVPEEVVCFDSFEECARLMGALLADSDARQAIGRRARARAHREHTYEHRLTELLETTIRRARA
jgi:spore maturation protein CgeB